MSTEALKQGSLHARFAPADDFAQSPKGDMPRAAFAQRHPILTYVVAPLPILVALWVAYLFALIALVSLWKPVSYETWHANVAGVLINGLAYVPSVLVMLAITWTVVRSASKLRWWLIGSLPVVLFSALLVVSFRMPTAPGNGNLSVGLSLPPGLAQVPQFIVPLVAALALMAFCHLRRPPMPAR